MSPPRPSDDRIELRMPAAVTRCVQRVVGAGSRVFAVGGVVRDAWLGIRIDDWDFASSLRPQELAPCVADLGEIDVVERLGRVAIRADGHEVVFTTFRQERVYGSDRRPAWVRFVTTPALDAMRRDFTVNAIYVDTAGGAVVDPTGGVEDLRARRLRVIGDPRRRLAEDPLRILRAVRFEASRGLTPTASTAIAIAEFAPRTAALQPERRFVELRGALIEGHSAGAVLRMLDCGLLGYVVPSLRGDEHRVRTEAVPLLDAAAPRSEVEGWAALLGNPARAEAALGELRSPRSLRNAVVRLLTAGERLAAWDRWGSAARRREIRALPGPAVEFLAARERLRGGAAWAAAWLRAFRERGAGIAELPTGRDVLALGVAPGPQVGAVLRAVRERVERDDVLDPAAVAVILRDEVHRAIKSEPDRSR